jgi:hypothetical protein
METQDLKKIFFKHSTTSLNDVPSRKRGTFGTPVYSGNGTGLAKSKLFEKNLLHRDKSEKN